MLKIELLNATHDRGGFDCGSEPLNHYLRQIARQHVEKGISKTFVLIEETATEPKPVLGFFSLSLCQVTGRDLPLKLAKRLPGQTPAVKLGRLAVASDWKGKGLGKALLVEAIEKTAQIAKIAGGIGLFVDAKDEAAAAFYRNFGFEALPGSALTLFMPMSTVVALAKA